MANYDEQVLGTGNINHPANERDLTDREMLTEVYNVSKEVLEIFDNLMDLLDHKNFQLKNTTRRLVEADDFLSEIKTVLSQSENGICIILKNKIENFLNK